MDSVFIRWHRCCHHQPMTDATVCVRRYLPSDREAVVLLAPRLQTGVAHWRDTRAVRRAATGWIEASLGNAHRDGHEVFVAHLGEDVIGLVTVAERRHFTGEIDAYVGELAVKAEHERRGVGTLLMDAAEEWARRRGLRHLTLETGAANGAARAFYDRCGYQEEDVRLTKTLVPASSTAKGACP
jgi:ribosomal protein S18 acetylase RimI-like enzyme